MRILLIFALLVGFASAEKEHYLGDLTGYEHGVRGSVSVVGEDTLRIENFHYDGEGPDAFFYVGRTGQPSGAGTIIPYPRSFSSVRPRRLARSDGESVLLTLPEGWKTSELKWISVWCRQFGVNFGDLIVEQGMREREPKVTSDDDDGGREIDELLNAVLTTVDEDEGDIGVGVDDELSYLGDLTSYAHGISGSIYEADEGTLIVKDFHYDGKGPDAFFYIGKTGEPSSAGILVRYPTWNVEQKLEGANGEDLTLVLPQGYKVSELKWISVWCRQFEVNFADLILDVGVPVAVDVGAPVDPVDEPDLLGEVFPDEDPGETFTPDVTDENKGGDGVNFNNNNNGGGIDIDEHFPGTFLGKFKTIHHGVSGTAYVVDDFTIMLEDFVYDGQGVCRDDTYFLIGDRGRPNGRRALVVPYPPHSSFPLPAFDGSSPVVLRLPPDCPASEVKWLSVWCRRYGVDFGNVRAGRDQPPARFRGSNDGSGKIDLRKDYPLAFVRVKRQAVVRPAPPKFN